MIPTSLITHRATVTRQGMRTSNAGDTVADGIYVATPMVDVECCAEQVSGGTDPVQQRKRSRSRWDVYLGPATPVLVRDRVSLIDTYGMENVVDVVEVRRYSALDGVAHVRLSCEEVTG